MIGLCFKYDAGFGSLLRDEQYMLEKAFEGITMFERGVPDSEKADYNGYVINKVDNADDLPQDAKLVVVSGQNALNVKGDINLKDYVHPENAIYFFGDDHSHLSQEIIGERLDYDKVYIPISENVWSTQAMTIVLYDRLIKNG